MKRHLDTETVQHKINKDVQEQMKKLIFEFQKATTRLAKSFFPDKELAITVDYFVYYNMVSFALAKVFERMEKEDHNRVVLDFIQEAYGRVETFRKHAKGIEEWTI